jgi:hypothetical protein
VIARPLSTTTFLTSPYSTSTVGGSIYFDGNSFLSISSGTIGQFTLGTGNFSFEAWIYPTSNAANQIIFNKVATSTVVGAFDLRLQSNGTLYYFASNTSGASWNLQQLTSGFVNFNSWNHIAYIRVGDWYKTFINGVAAQTANIMASPSLSLVDEPTVPINIGANQDGTTPGSKFAGYITGIRMVRNYSLYNTTTNFSPPLTPPTASLTGTTLILMNGNGASIYDATSNNHIMNIGSSTINTSVVKFGAGSMSFATGSRLLIIGNTNTNFTVGTGDFTMECWINFTSNSSAEADIFESATTNFPRILKRGSSAGLSFDYFSGALGSQLFMSDASLNSVLGSWFHLAVSRASGTLKGFVNGSQVFSVSDTTSIPVPTAQISIGSRYDGSNSFNGYISDFRFTKGVARYTTSFTSATTYLPLI